MAEQTRQFIRNAAKKMTAPAATGRRSARDLAAPALAALLFTAGVAHLVVPRVYESVIPRSLPGAPRSWVLVSGGAELACAAAIATRRTRRVGATAAALLFVVIVPANVKMAIDWSGDGLLKATIAIVRVPLQVPLIYWALIVRRQAAAPN